MIFLLLLLQIFGVHQSSAAINLTSPIVTNWGTWGPFEICPEGTKVMGVQLKTEVWNFWNSAWDDTCLNAIRFYCGTPGSNEISKVISSSEGQWGTWGEVTFCHAQSYAIGFMLRVEEEDTPLLDETATNALRILCAGSENGFREVHGGEQWGLWTNPRICDPNHQYFCGIQTQVEEPQGICKCSDNEFTIFYCRY